MVGCSRCTYPSIHLSFHCADTLKITVGSLVCGVWCVLCVCACGVCGVWVVCVHVVLCVRVLWCVVMLGTLSLSCSLTFLLSLSLSCSLSFSPLFLPFSSRPFLLHSHRSFPPSFLLSQLLNKFSSCMALFAPTASPSSCGSAPLSLMTFSLTRFHNPLCAIKPSISNLFRIL